MIRRPVKAVDIWGRIIKSIIGAQLVGAAGVLVLGYKLRSEREFRFYIKNTLPSVLDWYYYIDERTSGELKQGQLTTKQKDLYYWKVGENY